MGNWAITIKGAGCHHNQDNHTDADKMAHQFVNKLVEAGHQIDAAEFQVLTQGREPEALREGVATIGALYEPAPSAEAERRDTAPASEGPTSEEADDDGEESSESKK